MTPWKTALTAICLAAGLFAAGCSGKSTPRVDPRGRKGGWEKAAMGKSETGIASWYGDKFQGRRTANGEVYDMNRLTAAHLTLPFNSIVEVVNLDNRKSIIVRINDRGPFVKNRIIDLSFKAAKILGMAEKGTAPVELRIIKPGISRLNPDGFFTGQTFIIQAGAFSRQENARRLLSRLNRIEGGLKFRIQLLDGLHKVLSQKIDSRREAEKWFEILTAEGIDVFIRDNGG